MSRDFKPLSILIVKLSALGDVIQSFAVLEELHRRFPLAQIDWAVETNFSSIVTAHPLIHRTISLDIKGRRHLWQGLQNLRKERYDLIFDLQGNCKSGVVTLLARGKVKVGYGLKTVREWPNVLATHVRFNLDQRLNMRAFYLGLIEAYLQSPSVQKEGGIRFKIDEMERAKITHILAPFAEQKKIMVCPGSKWANKQLKLETWLLFLQRIEREYDASFLLIWGNEAEKNVCEQLRRQLKRGVVVDKLPLPTWQNLMSQVDLVLAVDSSALHLCAMTTTPTFSIFGPSAMSVFKPFGSRHGGIQGTCPYGKTFDKTCPILRTCDTGACIKELSVEDLFQAFQKLELLNKKRTNSTGRIKNKNSFS